MRVSPATPQMSQNTAQPADLEQDSRPVSARSRRTYRLSTGHLETIEEKRLVTREEFDRNLAETIEGGDLDKISELLTPYDLTKCKINCLEKSLEVSYKLRKQAHGADEEDFEQMAAAVEGFAFHLLDPLKNFESIEEYITSKLKEQDFNREACEMIKSLIERDFDRVIDKAVAFKQKKFLSHPVTRTLLKKRWKGKFHETLNSKIKWMLLILFAVFDVSLFLLLFPVLYLIHLIIPEKVEWDPYEYYREYFTTPYFIFARDTISYLVLLCLHYAICLTHTSSETNSLIQYIILVFFLGRLLMEINQLASVMIPEDRKSGDSESNGVKDKQTKWKNSKIILSRYVGDWWNLLDMITLFIFIVAIALWLSTVKGDNTYRNRTLSAVEYLYGINTILLTLRVFGHLMETKKITGSTQIALFNMIGAVFIISGQFLAVLLAFSFAITKTYLAGESFSSNTMGRSNDNNKTLPLKFWWKSFGNLTWSLLGEVDQWYVTSSDHTSQNLAKVLYGIFLIMGGVMLLNMLIALLTNTYQKVENNAYYEWNHKKAITIRTYCTYHPVPIPFNIVSLLFKFARYVYRSITCKNTQDEGAWNNDYSHEFKDLVDDLQSKYFLVFGYSFPKTDGEKINDLVKETKGCRRLMGNIACRVFEYNLEEKQKIARTYRKELKWNSHGIKIDGQRITYKDCGCNESRYHSPTVIKYNGGILDQPLLPEWPAFEVLILECTELRFIVIGLVDVNMVRWYPHNAPGSQGNSVGYHVHEGKIFDKQNPKDGRYVKVPSASRGDVIGCELMHAKLSPDGSLVHFTLNGEFIGDGFLRDKDENGNPVQLRPFVGIGSEGITLLFRMQSKDPILRGIDSMNDMVQYQWPTLERSQEMHASSDPTELFEETKRSLDDMITEKMEILKSQVESTSILDLQKQVDILKDEVEFLKGKAGGSSGADFQEEEGGQMGGGKGCK